MNKKNIALLLVLVLCFAGLAGCAKNGEKKPEPAGTPQSEAPSSEPVTLRFAGFSAGEENGQTLQGMLALFADAYPHITVIDESGAYGDYSTELDALIGSGSAPDVFELDYQDIMKYMDREAIAPLDEMAGGRGLDIYRQGLVDRLCTARGSLMALPFSYSTEMLVYNMDLFNAAGLAYPTNDWVWNDLLLAAQKIAKPEEDVWGYYFDITDADAFCRKAYQNGDRFYSGKGEFTISNALNVETLQWMQDLIWVYHITPTETELNGRSAEDLFVSGRLGMFPGDARIFDDLRERCGDIRWGVAIEPGNIYKATRVSCNVLCVSSAADAPGAAYTLAHFLTGDPDVQGLRLDAGWDLPTVSDPAVMDAYAQDTPPANKAAVLDSTDYAFIPAGRPDLDLLAYEILTPHLIAVRENAVIPLEALNAAQAEAERQSALSRQ